MAIASIPLAGTTAAAEAGPKRALHGHRFAALGTSCDLQCAATGRDEAQAFFSEAESWVQRFDAHYSRFKPDSRVSIINANAGTGNWCEVDAEMDRMLDLCGALHAFTRGILDPTIGPLLRLWDYRQVPVRLPDASAVARTRTLVGWEKVQRRPGAVRLPLPGMSLDLGGWGKEYAVDKVAEIARRRGIDSALIDFGHDVFALGQPIGRPAWHVGLEDPRNPGQHRGSLALRDRAAAGSGDYRRGFTVGGRRYGHILDPRSGSPVDNQCIQVIITASSCLQAGALATAAFVLGPEAGLRLIQECVGAEGRVVSEHAIHQTRGFVHHVAS